VRWTLIDGVDQFRRDGLAAGDIAQVRLVLMAASLQRAAISAKCCNHTLAIKRALNAFPAVDGIADCCVDVCDAVLASFADVGD